MPHNSLQNEFPPHNPADFFTSPPRLSSKLSPGVFFGSPYEQNADIHDSMASILSGSHIQASCRFPMELRCFLFKRRPPLQYLNEKRVDAAKELLLTTDYRIHEIGSIVGIDNTNHFIYLFKKFTGMTPLTFRRKL